VRREDRVAPVNPITVPNCGIPAAPTHKVAVLMLHDEGVKGE
jgi:hypothetical protein